MSMPPTIDTRDPRVKRLPGRDLESGDYVYCGDGVFHKVTDVERRSQKLTVLRLKGGREMRHSHRDRPVFAIRADDWDSARVSVDWAACEAVTVPA